MSDNLPDVRRPERTPARIETDDWIPVASDVFKLASHIAVTEFVPKSLRDNPPAVAAAILFGREIGLGPMTALTQTHVIEGKPAMSAEGMRALVLAAGHEIVIEETTGALCRMKGRRSGSDTWTSITWTIDMARSAGVANKQVWKSYPRQMLQARATTELARLAFPDVIHGFRSLEEFNVVESDAEDADGNTAPASSGRVARKRTTRKTTGTRKKEAAPAPTEPPADDAAPPLPGTEDDVPPAAGLAGGLDDGASGDASGEAAGPPADEGSGEGAAPADIGSSVEPRHASSPEPDDDGVVDAEVVDEKPDDEPEAKAPPAKASRAQMRQLFALIGGCDVGDDERHIVVGALLDREVGSFSDLSKRDAHHLIETLARCESREQLDAVIDAVEQHGVGGDR